MKNLFVASDNQNIVEVHGGCDVCQRGKAFPEMPAGNLCQTYSKFNLDSIP